MTHDHESRTARLEKEILAQRKIIIMLSIIVLSMIVLTALTAFRQPGDGVFTSIRARKLIIEDENQRDRIIVSSEICSSPSRKRKDTLSGVLVLDSSGNDRVILGASPTFKISENMIIRRSANGPYGIAFNDEQGVEKGGMGYYADRKLSAFGLDGPSGEGIALFVPEKEMYGQKAGLIINDPQQGGQLLYLGANTRGERVIVMDVQGKGRVASILDSNGRFSMKLSDYVNNREKSLIHE